MQLKIEVKLIESVNWSYNMVLGYNFKMFIIH